MPTLATMRLSRRWGTQICCGLDLGQPASPDLRRMGGVVDFEFRHEHMKRRSRRATPKSSGKAQVPTIPQPTAATQASNSPQPNLIAHPPLFSQEVKKTIAIIYTMCDGDPQTYEGTAFFVSKDDPRLGGAKSFAYMVTNKHVAEPHIETGKPCKVTKQVIRVNSKTPDPLTGGRNALFLNTSQWVYPTDDAIDLAVIPFMPDETKYDVKAIPMSLFATREVVERENIAEGDPVLYTGYFYQFPGSLQIEPIIRQGIIAMIPGESIPTTLEKLGKAYLADAHVFGGNSGSPMFVNIGGTRNGVIQGGSRYLFLGVVSGLEPEETDVALQPVTTYSGKIGANSGVSFIVPADQVADLVNGPAMAALREEVIKNISTSK